MKRSNFKSNYFEKASHVLDFIHELQFLFSSISSKSVILSFTVLSLFEDIIALKSVNQIVHLFTIDMILEVCVE